MRFIVFLILYNTCNNVYTQNLVVNESFENFDTIELFENRIIDWLRIGTTDYYSEINSLYVWQIPCTPVGCQYSNSGISHVGLYNNSFIESNYREYIHTRLISKLISGKNYCVSFYISRGDTMEYASKDWGILFTDTTIQLPSNPGFNIISNAQVTVPYFVTDDENWTLIQQIYTPTSPNEYLTIGNFLHDSVFPQQFVQASCSGCKQSYYYIDDVSVSLIRPPVLPDSISIYSGESIMIGDTTQDAAQYFWSPMEGLNNPNNFQTMAAPSTTTTYILTKITACDTSEAKIKIEVLANENNITVMPNPTNNSFQVKYNLTEDADFVIYDALGRKAYQTPLTAGSNLIFSPEIKLASALYFVTLETENKRLFETKMMVAD
jgi:hypothetical protein